MGHNRKPVLGEGRKAEAEDRITKTCEGGTRTTGNVRGLKRKRVCQSRAGREGKGNPGNAATTSKHVRRERKKFIGAPTVKILCGHETKLLRGKSVKKFREIREREIRNAKPAGFKRLKEGKQLRFICERRKSSSKEKRGRNI